MGFITNQWLEGEAMRYRRYKPVEVKISGESVPFINDSITGRLNGFVNVAFEIRAKRSNGDYQEMFLNQDEVDELLPAMIEVGEQSVRLKITLSILAGLTDEELSQFMEGLLSERAKTTVSGSVESQAADT